VKNIITKSALVLLIASLVLAFGCTRDKAYHPIISLDGVPESSVTMQIENHGWNVYSEQRELTGVQPDIYRTVEFDKFWVEYSDSGEPHYPSQMAAVLNHIEQIKTQSNTKIYVSVFIHGWNQNADNSEGADNDGVSSSDAVKFDYYLARQAEQLRRLHEQRNIQEIPQVVGIYIGWRGNTTDIPLLLRTTLGNRSAAADRIAQNRSETSLYHFLDELTSRTSEINEQNRVLIAGHSLGGRLVSQLVMEDLERGESHPFGDQVLLLAVEPAIGADCFSRLASGQSESAEIDTPPSLWLITSRNDKALTKLYPISAFLNIAPCHRDSEGHLTAIGMYKPFKTHTMTIEHIEHIRNDNYDTAPRDFPNAGFLARGKPSWVEGGPELQNLLYYMRDTSCANDTVQKLSECYNTRDALRYTLEVESFPASIDRSLVWNIFTDRNTINYGGSHSDTIDALHNGYVSTNLSRLLIEWLYRD